MRELIDKINEQDRKVRNSITYLGNTYAIDEFDAHALNLLLDFGIFVQYLRELQMLRIQGKITTPEVKIIAMDNYINSLRRCDGVFYENCKESDSKVIHSDKGIIHIYDLRDNLLMRS